jgi:hypothetical protein
MLLVALVLLLAPVLQSALELPSLLVLLRVLALCLARLL